MKAQKALDVRAGGRQLYPPGDRFLGDDLEALEQRLMRIGKSACCRQGGGVDEQQLGSLVGAASWSSRNAVENHRAAVSGARWVDCRPASVRVSTAAASPTLAELDVVGANAGAR